MTIFSVLTLFGGLAFFLYGMHVMSGGLEKTAGNRLKKTLESMTSSPFKAILLGAGITIAIQSSSAMTVMLVGFVNSGIMELSQTVGLIMGSNVGTTLTAWILSLAGIESNNIFISLLKPMSFSPILAFVGIVLVMLSKKPKRKSLGEIMLGFAVLMFGMELMSSAVAPLADMPQFTSMLTYFHNPILGVLTGAIFTGIIQSSAASVGILQALSMTGGITYGIALPIIMGQNIGTCVTSIISSIGASKNAKRVAAVHVIFNIIGTALFLIVIYTFNAIWPIAILEQVTDPLGIAVMHSIFNIATTLVLLPFGKVLVKLATLFVPEGKKQASDFDLVDERLLVTPAFAVAECKNVIQKMFEITRGMVLQAIGSLQHFTTTDDDEILKNEDIIDTYEDRLGTFLVRLTDDLSEDDRKRVAQMLRAIGDLERISDHACNILESAEEMHDKQIHFSNFAQRDLAVVRDAVVEILSRAERAFIANDISLAETVEPLEACIDELKDAIFARHIERLQRGICTIELGFIISNILNNYERIADHCSNLATGVIKANDLELQMDYHSYVHELKAVQRVQFEEQVAICREQYALPDANGDSADNTMES